VAKAADEVEMATRPQPGAVDDRRRRGRGATDDVGLADREFEIVGRLRGQSFVAQHLRHRLRADAAAPPDPQARHVAAVAVRACHVGRQAAGADDQHVLGVGTREVARREQRRGGRAAQRERLAVDDGQRRAAGALEQDVDRVDGGPVALAVAGHHRDELDAERALRAVAPRRHQQQRVGRRQRVRVPQRHDRIRSQHVGDRVRQGVQPQRPMDLLGVEELHGRVRCGRQAATQLPDLPPRFSSRRTPPISIPRSTALHMS
jgi:hypothetical protein